MRSHLLPRLIVLISAVTALAACESRPTDQAAQVESGQSAPQPGQGSDSPRATQSGVRLLEDLPDVVDSALPGVVGISTRVAADSRRDNRPPHPFFDEFPSPFGPGPDGPGGPPGATPMEMGSGVIVSAEGYVLTNNHVVQNADEIQVQIEDDRRYEARVVGTDSASDLAVLQLEDPPENLRVLDFADAQGPQLGEPVVAIGNPFGLSSTVTLGIISATGRENIGITDYEDFIQTDAAINPGNSGGPLINMDGEVVGINTAILSRSGGYQGIGFSIPAPMAQSIMQSLIDDGEVSRGWLGVVIQTMNPELAEALELPENTDGVVVSDVQQDSPADEAGLQRGDVIFSFADTDIDSASSLRNRVAMQSPGTEVELGVLRDGERQAVELTLGEQPAEASPGEQQQPQDDPRSPSPLQGLQLAPLTPELRARLDVPDEIDSGVVVERLIPGTPASRIGLQPGDVILELNRQPLDSPRAFARAFQQAENQVLFLVFRDGNTLFLAARKP
ncbi:MAG: DegQ family serine endoprotease [Persicimonas sp.]